MQQIILLESSDIARLRAGELLQLREGLMLSLSVKAHRSNGTAETPAEAKPKRVFKQSEEQRARKRAYMKKWHARHPHYHTVRERQKREAAGSSGLTRHQIMRQPKPLKNGKMRCRVCQQEFSSWESLRSHAAAAHLQKGVAA